MVVRSEQLWFQKFSEPCGTLVQVYANDLNPESYKCLVDNIRLNKVRGIDVAAVATLQSHF